jgi:hypothetical protein
MFDLDPNSAPNLRKRAERLKDSPYKLILNLTADQLEINKITKREAVKIIKYIRTCDDSKMAEATKMLNLNQEQISTMLQLLEKMK